MKSLMISPVFPCPLSDPECHVFHYQPPSDQKFNLTILEPGVQARARGMAHIHLGFAQWIDVAILPAFRRHRHRSVGSGHISATPPFYPEDSASFLFPRRTFHVCLRGVLRHG